jgi:hypothetical protein
VKPKTREREIAYLSAPQVCARYGNRSHMFLVRKLQFDPKFPRPIYMGRLRFFKLEALEEYERQCVAAPPPPNFRRKSTA